MKPILRALLVVDGVITLVLGLALVASPWADTIVTLQALKPEPPALGQLFGITLLGFAWLQLHAAFDGQLTVAVARVSGHVGWISGIVLLIWLIALHSATVDANRAIYFSGPAIAVVLLVIGIGLARIAGAVHRKNRLQATEAALSTKAERDAAARQPAPAEPMFARPVAVPVRPAVDPVAGASARTVVDPVTGQERVVRETDPLATLPPDDIRRPL